MLRARQLLTPLLLLPTLTACPLITGPEARGVIGALDADDPRAVEAPEVVTAGEPFDVVVRTWGSDGCWEAAGAEVDARRMTVKVTPYDRHRGGAGIACTQAIVELERTVRLSFPEPGDGRLLVNARTPVPTNDGFSFERITIERVIQVE